MGTLSSQLLQKQGLEPEARAGPGDGSSTVHAPPLSQSSPLSLLGKLRASDGCGRHLQSRAPPPHLKYRCDAGVGAHGARRGRGSFGKVEANRPGAEAVETAAPERPLPSRGWGRRGRGSVGRGCSRCEQPRGSTNVHIHPPGRRKGRGNGGSAAKTSLKYPSFAAGRSDPSSSREGPREAAAEKGARRGQLRGWGARELAGVGGHKPGRRERVCACSAQLPAQVSAAPPWRTPAVGVKGGCALSLCAAGSVPGHTHTTPRFLPRGLGVELTRKLCRAAGQQLSLYSAAGAEATTRTGCWSLINDTRYVYV